MQTGNKFPQQSYIFLRCSLEYHRFSWPACVFSCCWSTWSAWCLDMNAVWEWRWWRDKHSLPQESPAKWKSSKPWSHFLNTTKLLMRRYDRASSSGSSQKLCVHVSNRFWRRETNGCECFGMWCRWGSDFVLPWSAAASWRSSSPYRTKK